MGITLMNSSSSLMSEGKHILRIDSVEYDADFGKLKIVMKNSKGEKHYENFSFIKQSGENNEKSLLAFSAMARAAMHDTSIGEIEPKDLVGKFLKGELVRDTYEGKDGNIKHKTVRKQGSYWEECTADEEGTFGAATAKSVANPVATSATSILDILK